MRFGDRWWFRFFYYLGNVMPLTAWIIIIASIIVFLFIVSFFRSPKRYFTISLPQIICPADGKVVVMEEIFDTEYFQEKRLQVSIFMSPANVHINRIPMSGEVVYSQYHKGKYLVAVEFRAVAKCSLPVPDSPRIKTLRFVFFKDRTSL